MIKKKQKSKDVFEFDDFVIEKQERKTKKFEKRNKKTETMGDLEIENKKFLFQFQQTRTNQNITTQQLKKEKYELISHHQTPIKLN